MPEGFQLKKNNLEIDFNKEGLDKHKEFLKNIQVKMDDLTDRWYHLGRNAMLSTTLTISSVGAVIPAVLNGEMNETQKYVAVGAVLLNLYNMYQRRKIEKLEKKVHEEINSEVNSLSVDTYSSDEARNN